MTFLNRETLQTFTEEQIAFLIEACQFVQATNKLFAPENEEKNDD